MSVYKVVLSADQVVAASSYDTIMLDSLKISSAGEFDTSTYTFSPLQTVNPVTYLVMLQIEIGNGEAWVGGEQVKLKLDWNTGSSEKVHTVAGNHSVGIGMAIHTLVTVPYNSWMKASIWHDSAVSHTLFESNNLVQINIASQTEGI